MPYSAADIATSVRHRAELAAKVRDAMRRGWRPHTIGMLIAHDGMFVQKVLEGHRFKPSTLAAAHRKLSLLDAPAPMDPQTERLLAL